MEVRKFVFPGSNEFKSVKYEMINLETLGTLVVFCEGGIQMIIEVCNWVRAWVEKDFLNAKVDDMLKDVVVRVNKEILKRNASNFINLSLVLIGKKESIYVSFGGSCVLSCKKGSTRPNFTKGAEFCLLDGKSKSLGMGEIDSNNNEFKSKKITFSNPGTERILLFGHEYGNFLKKSGIDLHGFINKNNTIDRVSENIEKSLKMYISNRNTNNTKFSTLSGVLIEIER